jgi:hypothetical protein
LFLEGPEREVKDSSIDIVYQKLLEDLKQYCTEQKIEEECREKRKERLPQKRRGKAKQ